MQIWASDTIDNGKGSCMGKWDLRSSVSSSSELCGPDTSINDGRVPRHVKFSFKKAVRCRIIWITIRLQKAGSSSVNLDKNFSLLSFDENPFAEPSRHASFGGQIDSEPCIHAKKILVVGRSVRNDVGTSSQGSDSVNVRNWLERAPQLSRFKVKFIHS